MTHITERRVIGNHADLAAPPPGAVRRSLSVTEILRAGLRRRARRRARGEETTAAESIWDSEGGAAGDVESYSFSR